MNPFLLLAIVYNVALSSADLVHTNIDNDLKQVEKASAKRIISRIFLPHHEVDTKISHGSNILDMIKNKLQRNAGVASNEQNSNDLSLEVKHDGPTALNLRENLLKLLARRNEDESDDGTHTAREETELNADILSSLLENMNVTNVNTDGNRIRKGKLIIYYDGDKNDEKEISLENLAQTIDPAEIERKNINSEIIDLYNRFNISLDIYNRILDNEFNGDISNNENFNKLLRALYRNGLYEGVDPRILKKELSSFMIRHNIEPADDLYWYTPVMRSGAIDMYDDSNNSLDIEDIINNILNNRNGDEERNKSDDILVIPVDKKVDSEAQVNNNTDNKDISDEDLLNIILSSSESRNGNDDLPVGRTGVLNIISPKPKGDTKLSSTDSSSMAVISNQKVNPLNVLDELRAAYKKINYKHSHKYSEHTISSEHSDDYEEDGGNDDEILNDLLNKLNISDFSSEDDVNGNDLESSDSNGLYSSDLSSLKHLVDIALKEPLVNKHYRRILSNKPINTYANNIRGKPFSIYIVFHDENNKRFHNRTKGNIDLLDKIKTLLLSRVHNDDHSQLLQQLKDLLRSGSEGDNSQEKKNNDSRFNHKLLEILQKLFDEKLSTQERKDPNIWEIIREPNSNNDKKSIAHQDKEKIQDVILQWLAERKINKNESHESRKDNDYTRNKQPTHNQVTEDIIALITGNQSKGKTAKNEDVYDDLKKWGLKWLFEIIGELKNHKSKAIEAENDIDQQTDRLIRNIIRIKRVLKSKNVPGHKIRPLIERLIQKGVLDITRRSVSRCTQKINDDLIRGFNNAVQKYAT